MDDLSYLSIKDDWFDQHSKLHGRLHTIRVMYWTKVVSEIVCSNHRVGKGSYVDLSADIVQKSGELAFFAAIIHDCARTHDGRCRDHGFQAAQTKKWILEQHIYDGTIPTEDWNIIDRALTLHCRNEGILSPNASDITLSILKDADALDRVRLGFNQPNLS